MPPRRRRRAQNGRPTAAPKQHPGIAGELISLPAVSEGSKVLECPICMAVPLPPVYSCPAGHTICGTCKTRVTNCSMCKLKFGNKSRNFVMESIINAAQFQCRHDGCEQVLRGDQMEAHLAVCEHDSPDRPAAQVDQSDSEVEVPTKGNDSAPSGQLPDVVVSALESVSLQSDPDPISDSQTTEAGPDAATSAAESEDELLSDDPDSALSEVELADSALPSRSRGPTQSRSSDSHVDRSRSRSPRRGSGDSSDADEDEEKSESRSNSRDEEESRPSRPSQASGRSRRGRRRRRRRHYFY